MRVIHSCTAAVHSCIIEPAAELRRSVCILRGGRSKRETKQKEEHTLVIRWNYLSISCSTLRWIVRIECFKKPENEQCNKLRKFVRQKDHKHNFPMINVTAKFVSYHINPKASIVNMTIRKNGHSRHCIKELL